MNRQEFLEVFEKHLRELKEINEEEFELVEASLENNTMRTYSLGCPLLVVSDDIGEKLGWWDNKLLNSYKKASDYFKPYWSWGLKTSTIRKLAKQMLQVYLKVKGD